MRFKSFKLTFILYYFFSYSIAIPLSIKKEITFFKNKYRNLMTFIHEFHHIIETDILTEEYTDKLRLHLISGDINNQKNICNAYVSNISFDSSFYKKSIFKNKNDKILRKIKFALAGYASEEAFKRESFLFRYFNQKEIYSFHTVSFLSMLYKHLVLEINIADIAYVLKFKNDINYNDIVVKKYIDNYKKKLMCNNFLMQSFIYKYHIEENFLLLVSALYEELIKKFSSNSHQEKIFTILEKNPEIAAYEIFFLQDLKSLWENHTLNRDISNIKSFTPEEKEIIKSLEQKVTHPLEIIKIFKNTYKKKKDYIYFFEKKYKKIKSSIKSFFKKNYIKGISFFNFFKKYKQYKKK